MPTWRWIREEGMSVRIIIPATALALGLFGSASVAQDSSQMSFFVTSAPLGDGANLGGLEGADAHCQRLAAAAGAGSRSWRAYLSIQGAGGVAPVNAKDRIGNGPWINAKG